MKRKRTAVGMIAGILYTLLLLYTAGSQLYTTIQNIRFLGISDYLEIFPRWYLPSMVAAGLSQFGLLLIIIALFGNLHAWLPLAALVPNILASVVNYYADDYLTATSAPMVLGRIALAVHVIFTALCCIPFIRKYTRWARFLWFLPVLASLIANVVNTVYDLITYWDTISYTSFYIRSILLGALLAFVQMTALLLRCLWMTEPLRKKKLQA